MQAMNLTEIADCSATLGAQLKAGIPINQATTILATLQPKRAEFWNEAAASIESGSPVSAALAKVWPESLVSAVIAGEQAGKNEEAFSRIESATMLQIELRRQLSKLLYPFAISVVGIVMFIVMMVVVVPMTSKSFTNAAQRNNFFTQLSMVMESFFKPYWPLVLAGVVGGVFLLYRWSQSEEGKQTFMNVGLTVPYLGQGLINLYFGVWAEYVALMIGAGIPTIEALKLTIKVLPERLRGGVEAFERDISAYNIPMSAAADPAKFGVTDPRNEWPLYVSRAFMVGESTGQIDTELARVSPLLVRQGTKELGRAIWVGNLVALILAASLIGMSFAAIYIPIFSAIQHAQ